VIRTRLWSVSLVLLLLAGCRSATEPPAPGPASAPSEPATLTDQNFDQLVFNSDKPVLVDFTATWCPPCKEMEPIVAQLAADYEGRAVVGKLDVDQNAATSKEYNVTAVPTFMVFKGVEVVERIEGATAKSDLAAAIDAVLE